MTLKFDRVLEVVDIGPTRSWKIASS